MGLINLLPHVEGKQQKRGCYECILYPSDEGWKPLMQLKYPEHLPRSRRHHNTESDVKDLVITLYQIHIMAQCLGAIAWTHIEVKQPLAKSTYYINRKGKHSLNVQVVWSNKNSFPVSSFLSLCLLFTRHIVLYVRHTVC